MNKEKRKIERERATSPPIRRPPSRGTASGKNNVFFCEEDFFPLSGRKFFRSRKDKGGTLPQEGDFIKIGKKPRQRGEVSTFRSASLGGAPSLKGGKAILSF